MNSTLPRCTRVVENELVALYLDSSDVPWVAALCEAVTALDGCTRAHVEASLAAIACDVPAGRRSLALDVIHSLLRFSTSARVSPRAARYETIRRRAALRTARGDVLHDVALKLGVGIHPTLTAEDVEAALFADVPAEQRLTPVTLEARDIVALGNQRLVRSVLARSLAVEIVVQGNARAIVRYAKLRGLIVSVSMAADAATFKLALSGPLAVCQRTTMYGRAVGDLLPQLAWCVRFDLTASIVSGEETLKFRISTGAPIAPSKPPRAFDSLLERRFARDLARHTTDWLLVREPSPVNVGSTLVFPDFLLRHRTHQELSCPVEIIGFWTEAYLERKLATYRDPHLAHTIICIDQRLGDGRAFPSDAHVVTLKRGRIPIVEVLAATMKLHEKHR